MVTGLISVPLAVGYLGNERYGLWMVTLSSFAFVSFLEFGITPTCMNRMASAYAEQNREEFSYYSSGGVAIGLCTFLLGMVIIPLISLVDWPAILNVTDPVARREVLPLIYVILLIQFGTVSLTTVDVIYSARMQVAKPRIYSTVASLVSFSMLLVGIHLAVNLPILALLASGPMVAYRLILLVELTITEYDLVVPHLLAIPAILKEFVPVSLFFMGIQMSSVVLSSLPNLAITRYLSLADVATFSVASRLVNLPLYLITAVLPVIWPAFTIAWKRNEKSWLRKWTTIACVSTCLSLFAYTLVITLFGNLIIDIWALGHIYVSPDTLFLLGIWLMLQACTFWLSTFLHSITDLRFELICYVLSALLLGILISALISGFGIVGVAIAMSVSLAIGSLIPMIWRVRRKLATEKIMASLPTGEYNIWDVQL